MARIASPPTTERKAAICHGVRSTALISAPPVENRAAAARTRRRAPRPGSMGRRAYPRGGAPITLSRLRRAAGMDGYRRGWWGGLAVALAAAALSGCNRERLRQAGLIDDNPHGTEAFTHGTGPCPAPPPPPHRVEPPPEPVCHDPCLPPQRSLPC